MSRPQSSPKQSAAETSRRSRIAFIGIALVAVAALAILLLQTKEPPRPEASSAANSTSPTAVTAPATTNATETNRPASALSKSKLGVFAGRWQRTDGDYAIDIESVGANGDIKARYFNPRPINVSRAEAFEKDGKTQMYLELRDENYPGSYYALTFNPADGTLAGIYYQALLRETYEVGFVRLR